MALIPIRISGASYATAPNSGRYMLPLSGAHTPRATHHLSSCGTCNSSNWTLGRRDSDTPNAAGRLESPRLLDLLGRDLRRHILHPQLGAGYGLLKEEG